MALSSRHKEKTEASRNTGLRLGLFEMRSLLSHLTDQFRSLTSSSPQTNKTNTSIINLKCLQLKLSSDKQLAAVFYIYSYSYSYTHSYSSLHTRSASI